MVVNLRRSRRSGRFTRAGSSNPLPGSSASPQEAVVAPNLGDSFALAAVMNPDNVHSPLFLHHADHPGLQIVSVQLDGSNYTQWCSAMKIALDAKNKIAFVDGSLPRPDLANPLLRIWSRCNSMVKSWLLNSVTKQIYGSILSFDDATEIWDDLHNRFHKTNLPRTFQLIQQIQDLRQGSMDLSGYYTTLKTLWDNLDGAEPSEMCLCCNTFNCVSQRSARAKVERGRIIKFLSGLNEKYSIIRSQIIMKKPLPDLAEICNILDQDDSQRQFNSVIAPTAFHVSHDTTQSSALTSSASTAPPSDLNNSQAGVLNAFHKKSSAICSHCGNTGHVIDRCYKLHGYPVGWKKGKPTYDKSKSTAVAASVSAQPSPVSGLDNLVGQVNKDQIQNFIAYFSSQLQTSESASVSAVQQHDPSGISFSSSTFRFVGLLSFANCVTDQQTWIIDSGATHHVSHDRSSFTLLDTSVHPLVNLPNGSSIKVGGVGKIVLTKSLTLENVLFIPEFRLNLMSISCLTSDLGARVIFDSGLFEIQDPSRGSMIGRGRRTANLYVLDLEAAGSPVLDASLFHSNAVVDAAVWHQRFGHTSVKRLALLSDVLGFSKAKNKGSLHCDICHRAKQKKLSYTLNPKLRAHPFDLLHIDVWGPFSEQTSEGYRYFLTIVDDHTRVTWVYLLRLKSDVLTVFPDFIQMVETQYSARVKSVRSDNAPELRFDALYKAKGIISYHSCAETPEQNSVVERKHQHILNVARALMFQSGVPLSLWGDCVLTSVFLINRTPSQVISNKTPYEMLTNKVLDYSHLKTFGCLCYASTSPKQRHKFQDRARACVFLGYPSGYKGYKLLDLENNNVLISHCFFISNRLYLLVIRISFRGSLYLQNHQHLLLVLLLR